MTKCLNLCEIISTKNINEKDVLCTLTNLISQHQRVYVGSYFCSQYFLKCNIYKIIYDIAKEKGSGMTLVIPVFSEKDLEKGKKLLTELMDTYGDLIDEITVNDIGMLAYVKKLFDKKINLGRLFFKDQRDARVPDYYERTITPNLLTYMEYLDSISLVELDRTNRRVELCNVKDVEVAMHIPFCYMTTGNICKFASINKVVESKFRPNCSCNQECASVYEKTPVSNDEQISELYRIGRTIYHYNNDIVENDISRIIYFPFKEMVAAITEED